MSLEMLVQSLQFIEQSRLGPITGILALQELHEGHEYLGAPDTSRKRKGSSVNTSIFSNKTEKHQKQEDYTEENSGGVASEGSGYFSSRIPTITSESATHLSSILIRGTFPSGLTSKNLSNNCCKGSLQDIPSP